METVVELSGVVAVLSSFPALAGIDLAVQRGEIVLLHGPNGAGKTSVLRVCAGLLPIERGEGSVMGVNLRTQRESVRERVGLLGHSNGLYLELTVAQNVAFWASAVGASSQEVALAMQQMKIDGRLADIKASQLSAGQRRRCALASLMVRRASLWLLDEPHAGLDTAGQDEFDAILRTAVNSGATVIFASHETQRSRSLATRVIRVEGGLISGGES
ncbi:MAG: heme ABC exporter ATP-binding protein CcmA [Ilumatobacteraceae bacterium]|nr:heme ABC exporter ATP-binding protein CcmA [Ilumatobacteraceae bacterium]